jgi:methionine aminopeptidase
VCRECGNIFKGKQIEKGIAFPTCVSINRCAADSSGSSSNVCNMVQSLHPQHVLSDVTSDAYLSFPAACSVVGHFSPMSDDSTTLKTGDLVKM